MIPGRIVVLNGAPRSGKSSIAAAFQSRVPGDWINLGVDAQMRTIPPHLSPGIGLRPGGERPDLEPAIARLYAALYEPSPPTADRASMSSPISVITTGTRGR